MKPDTRPEQRKAWLILAATLVVCLLGLWWLWDGGASKRHYTEAESAYELRTGRYLLANQVSAHRQVIGETQTQIDQLKALVGINQVAPFLKPERDSGGYIFFLIRLLHQELQLEAQSFILDERLGFNLVSTQPPSEAAAQGWLTMLQLVTKAIFLCTEAPGGIDEVAVTQLTVSPVATGPQSRPPLLDEYPFTLQVTGSLEAVSWLLMQFSSDRRSPENRDQALSEWLRMVESRVEAAGYNLTRNDEAADIGPLIVRGFNIIGTRMQENQISRLTVTFDLAGMDFWDNQARGETDALSELRRQAKQRNTSYQHQARP